MFHVLRNILDRYLLANGGHLHLYNPTVQAATKVCVCWHYPEDGVFVLAPRASCYTLCHVMTCNDDDITITTGTRLHASMQILSIQRTAMHTTLCTPQHNTGGGSRSTRVLLIWHFPKFCYVHLILGLIYPIRANALGFFALKCLNPIGPGTN